MSFGFMEAIVTIPQRVRRAGLGGFLFSLAVFRLLGCGFQAMAPPWSKPTPTICFVGKPYPILPVM